MIQANVFVQMLYDLVFCDNLISIIGKWTWIFYTHYQCSSLTLDKYGIHRRTAYLKLVEIFF